MQLPVVHESSGPASRRDESIIPRTCRTVLKTRGGGGIVKVKRENEALEDRLLCTVCMEADAPRAVVFGPCNHFLACASCAAALQECPNCRVPITTRTSIANTS